MPRFVCSPYEEIANLSCILGKFGGYFIVNVKWTFRDFANSLSLPLYHLKDKRAQADSADDDILLREKPSGSH